jgi:GT2 family glycosyltransferase
MRLLAAGVLPLPEDEKVTIILRSTRSDWTSFCLQTLERYTREPIEVLVIPDYAFDPQFAGIDRCNLALSQIDTRFFVLLDDSVIVTPNWLTRLLWAFYDDPTIGIISPAANSEEESAFCSDLDELVALSESIGRQNGGKWVPMQTLRGRCIACRTSLLNEIGGLDYSLRIHEARMLDWCLRARANGYMLALAKDSFVYELNSSPADLKEETHKWRPFRKKWGLEATTNPYSASGETNPPSLIPLTSETLSPPLVSAVVLSVESTVRTLCETLNSVEQQTYPKIEILLVRQGLPPHLPRSCRTPATGIWFDRQIPLTNALESVWRLAKGRYITYLQTGYTYDRDHIGRMTDTVHRNRAAIGVANMDGSDASDNIPLSAVMHLHPALEPVAFDIRTMPDSRITLAFNRTDPFEIVWLPEKTVKRRVKS